MATVTPLFNAYRPRYGTYKLFTKPKTQRTEALTAYHEQNVWNFRPNLNLLALP